MAELLDHISRERTINSEKYLDFLRNHLSSYLALTTRHDMMDRVRRACRAVTQQTLQRVMQNFKKRLTLCRK